MAILIVHLLEPIDIEHHHRHGIFRPRRAAQLDFQHLESVRPAETVREAVTQALVACLDEELHVPHRDRHTATGRPAPPDARRPRAQRRVEHAQHADRRIADDQRKAEIPGDDDARAVDFGRGAIASASTAAASGLRSTVRQRCACLADTRPSACDRERTPRPAARARRAADSARALVSALARSTAWPRARPNATRRSSSSARAHASLASSSAAAALALTCWRFGIIKPKARTSSVRP